MRAWQLIKNILHPLNWVQQRIDRWVMRRIQKQPGPIAVPRNRIYIVPTRFGWGFGAICVVMLLGAMNYSNSMAFALSFLLFSLGLICMHHTHANLLHLQFRAGKAKPIFAGEVAHFEVMVENLAARPRYALASGWAQRQESLPDCHVAAQSTSTIKLAVNAPRRGWLEADIFSISTEFPLGLFHAWTWAHLDIRCLVFPAPARGGLPPPQSVGSGGTQGAGKQGQDEFAGLRDYQRGDSMKSIHWKSLPKTSKPMVKQFSETVEEALWLEWNHVNIKDPEMRLSQLTRWILDAHAEGRAYGLRLPGTQLDPSCSESHRFECLKALALLQTQ